SPSVLGGLLLLWLFLASRRLSAAFSASNSRIYASSVATLASSWAVCSWSVMPAFYQPPQSSPEQLLRGNSLHNIRREARPLLATSSAMAQSVGRCTQARDFAKMRTPRIAEVWLAEVRRNCHRRSGPER